MKRNIAPSVPAKAQQKVNEYIYDLMSRASLYNWHNVTSQITDTG